MRSWSYRVVSRVVDAVDRPRLGSIRRRRQGEVGVAPSLEEDGNLIIDAAPPAVRPSIVESPITVNEAECNATVASPA